MSFSLTVIRATKWRNACSASSMTLKGCAGINVLYKIRPLVFDFDKRGKW